MKKQEFLSELRKGLSGLPQEDIDERIAFYAEMIDDRMEEGLSEEDAVRDIGTVDEIVSQIVSETPLLKIVKNKMKPKRKIQTWEIVLLVLGIPVWLPLLAAAVVVILAVYAVMWSVVVSLWAVFGSLAGCGIGGAVSGVALAVSGHVATGLALLAAGLVSGGLSVLLFFGCLGATKGMAILTKKIALGIKNCLIRRKEDA